MGGLVEQLPQSDSYVGLDPDRTDDHGNPVPGSTGASVTARSEPSSAPTRSSGRFSKSWARRSRWVAGPDATGPAYHHMGTTRMSADPDAGVVDADCRTHDLDNCWIASSSVFPTSGAMNPTLTIAALALRVADDVRDRL